jgi:hypothetical protein
MFKNKKALVMKALVRIIIAVVVFLLLILPACNKMRSALSSDTKSFEEFVDGINEMQPGETRSFLLKLNDDSVIAGFDKDADSFQCYNCGQDTGLSRITKKPENNEACTNIACICLCDGDFAIDYDYSGSLAYHTTGKCKSDFTCKALNADIGIRDIILIGERTFVFSEDLDVYWVNSFLFSRGINYVNGLSKNNDEIITLYVEKKAEGSENIIAVCNQEILDFNKEKLGLPEGTCLTPLYPVS